MCLFSVLCINAFHWYLLPGSGRKPSPLNETTSMVVETVEKRPGAKSLRRFRGDASKVNVRGPGLKKARCNQTQTFTIDVKDAGKYYQIITGKMQKIAHSWIRCTKRAIARFLGFFYFVFLNSCTIFWPRSAKIQFDWVVLKNSLSFLKDVSYSQDTNSLSLFLSLLLSLISKQILILVFILSPFKYMYIVQANTKPITNPQTKQQ